MISQKPKRKLFWTSLILSIIWLPLGIFPNFYRVFVPVGWSTNITSIIPIILILLSILVLPVILIILNIISGALSIKNKDKKIIPILNFILVVIILVLWIRSFSVTKLGIITP